MKNALVFVLTEFLALPVGAQTPEIGPMDGTQADLSEFLWKNRPIVVFADNPADPRFQDQLDFLAQDLPALETRDVVILTDADPAAKSALRQKLRPRGFALVVLAKDGSVILRKPLPWHVREITRTIDKQPLRQQEIRDRIGD